ncbi:MAG: hypothetical protein Q9225_008107, partial [Loekoesia sp. 1 TL-2023]
MYARRLKLMEALERKFAPLEKYHIDVVGLCEDTRGEIAFLRKKLGRTDPAADGRLPIRPKEKEKGGGEHKLEAAGVDVRDHVPSRDIDPKTVRVQSPAEQNTISEPPHSNPFRIRDSFFFFHNPFHRPSTSDITPTRLHLLRRNHNPTPDPQPLQHLPPNPRPPRRRLSKAHRTPHKHPQNLLNHDIKNRPDHHAPAQANSTLSTPRKEDEIPNENWRDIGTAAQSTAANNDKGDESDKRSESSSITYSEGLE